MAEALRGMEERVNQKLETIQEEQREKVMEPPAKKKKPSNDIRVRNFSFPCTFRPRQKMLLYLNSMIILKIVVLVILEISDSE